MTRTEKIRAMMRLYAITDPCYDSLYTRVESAIRGGATCIQLRDKQATHEEFMETAREMYKICKHFDVPFIVNDDMAAISEADGAHVGQSDMSCREARAMLGDKILGVSAQTVEEAVEAERNGADYLGIGAMFSTPTKTDAKLVSVETLREICATVHIPVVVIGGINENTCGVLANTGLAGLAVVSAVFAPDDVEAAARSMRKLADSLV